MNISKETLFQLYVVENLNIIEIGKKLGCSHSSIYRLLKRFEINKSKEKKTERRKKVYEKFDKEFWKRRNEKLKNTIKEKYGVDNISQADEIKRKKIETCIKNYNVENPSQSKEIQDRIKHNNLKRCGVESTNSLLEVKNKKITTCLKHFNCEYPGQCEDVQKKIKQTKIDKYGDPNYTNFEKAKETCRKHFGVDCYLSLPAAQEASIKTKLLRGTINTSKPEQKIKKLLSEKFSLVKYQYKSELYPFNCDFYIPEKDLYIEYQGFWTHGKEPFVGTENQLKIIENWYKKSNETGYKNRLKYMYSNAIYIWSKSDPLKRDIARKNNLNWIEFFTMDEFLSWYNSL